MTEAADSDDVEGWVSFEEAVLRLSIKFGQGARHVITEGLKIGSIRVRTSQVCSVSDAVFARSPNLLAGDATLATVVLSDFKLSIQDLDNLHDPHIPVDESSHKRGRPPDLVRWTTFWMAVVELAHTQQLNKANFAGPGALQDELTKIMGEYAFSPTTMKAQSRQIWKKFVKD